MGLPYFSQAPVEDAGEDPAEARLQVHVGGAVVEVGVGLVDNADRDPVEDVQGDPVKDAEEDPDEDVLQDSGEGRRAVQRAVLVQSSTGRKLTNALFVLPFPVHFLNLLVQPCSYLQTLSQLTSSTN